MDDYFYPTTDSTFDKTEYTDYTNSGGKMSLDEWRRENVNSLVSDIHTAVKSKDECLVFSISPSGDIEKNVSAYYADIPQWCKTGGYVDLIIPQLYYGFQNESKPFEDICLKWLRLERNENVNLCIGLAVYKYGKEDKYAGAGGFSQSLRRTCSPFCACLGCRMPSSRPPISFHSLQFVLLSRRNPRLSARPNASTHCRFST